MTDTRLVVVASGPQGPPGTLGLLELAPWASNVRYRKGAVVLWDDIIYASLVTTLNEQPDTHPGTWVELDIETHEGAQAKADDAAAVEQLRAEGVENDLSVAIQGVLSNTQDLVDRITALEVFVGGFASGPPYPGVTVFPSTNLYPLGV